MTATIWVAVLLLIGLAVMMLEVFIPSGGILGFVSVAAILAAVGTAFLQIGAVAGMTVLAITVLAVPTVLSLAFRWFPETPLGRRRAARCDAAAAAAGVCRPWRSCGGRTASLGHRRDR